mmetsp:Transcript_58923/g.138092  ORF Transcript_58923/g.138092 Transcript_58923/m.138092 type:complete len:91 (-) Transcript_58923:109-381(-)
MKCIPAFAAEPSDELRMQAAEGNAGRLQYSLLIDANFILRPGQQSQNFLGNIIRRPDQRYKRAKKKNQCLKIKHILIPQAARLSVERTQV